MTNEKLLEVSKAVTNLLSENQASLSDVHRIFREVELHLQVVSSDLSAPASTSDI